MFVVENEDTDMSAEQVEEIFDRGDAFLRKRYGDDAPTKHPELLAAYVAATARLHAAEIMSEGSDTLDEFFSEAMEQAAAEAALEADTPKRNKRKR